MSKTTEGQSGLLDVALDGVTVELSARDVSMLLSVVYGAVASPSACAAGVEWHRKISAVFNRTLTAVWKSARASENFSPELEIALRQAYQDTIIELRKKGSSLCL